MKKTLLLGLLTLTGLSASAQLPTGSQAPDFTATDINGNTHTLSEYLNAGKTVILDISATWCGPCWNYHSSHALSDLTNSYGPLGSDEVMVLFVEGDAQTTLADIYGTGNNTQGDWTDGATYPIIDDASISALYQIAYFPTVYRICPDGNLTLIGAQNVTNLRNGINASCQPLTGVENHAELRANDMRFCESTGDVAASFKNYGTTAITSATVVFKENGSVVATQDFTGTVAPYGATNLTFEGLEFDFDADYEFELTNINSAAPYSADFSTKAVDVILANESQNNLDIRVYTDNYPGEISWRIKDSEGVVVASGGPYQAGPGAAGAGGPDANTVKVHWIDNMPEGIDCYSVELLDSYGDGWSLGNTPHGFEIRSSGEIIFQRMVQNFGSLDVTNAAFKTNGTLSNTNFEVADKFAIYPNPSTGVFNFSTNEEVNVTVMDLTGKVVFTAEKINNGGSINLSSLQKGMYIAKVNGAVSERVEKIIIN